MRGIGAKTRSVSLPSHAAKKLDFSSSRKMKRSVSTPGTQQEVYSALKSAMRVASLDESLHKKGLKKNPKRPSAIEWDEIRIREYTRAVGDNPSCSAGPPVSIGWKYNAKEIKIKVEKYEEKRPPRRSMQEMVLPRDVRFKMLTQEWEVSRKDCANATRESLKVKNQRRQTVRNIGKVNPKMEESMESVGKMFKRSLTFKKKTSKELEAMMKDADRAQATLATVAAKDYEWESDDEDGSVGSRQESKTLDRYDAVGLPLNPEDDGGEAESSGTPKNSTATAPKNGMPPPTRQSMTSSGRPIIIASEDDACMA